MKYSLRRPRSKRRRLLPDLLSSKVTEEDTFPGTKEGKKKKKIEKRKQLYSGKFQKVRPRKLSKNHS